MSDSSTENVNSSPASNSYPANSYPANSYPANSYPGMHPPAPGTSPAEKGVPSISEAQARIMAMPVTDENAALNIIVSFINIAQRRGCFSIDESAKIWECIKKFQR